MLRYIEDTISKNQYTVLSWDNFNLNNKISLFDVLAYENSFTKISSIKLSIPKFGTILELDLAKNLFPLGTDFFNLPILDKQKQAMELCELFEIDKIGLYDMSCKSILTTFNNILLKSIYIEDELLGKYLLDNPDTDVYLNILMRDDVYGFLDCFDYTNKYEQSVIHTLMEKSDISSKISDVQYRFKGKDINIIFADLSAVYELSERWFDYLKMTQYSRSEKYRDEFTRALFENIGHDVKEDAIYDITKLNFIDFHLSMLEDESYNKINENYREKFIELYNRLMDINLINKHNENCDDVVDNYYFYKIDKE